MDFLQIARSQLSRYGTVRIEQAEVVDARSIEGGFAVALRDGTVLTGRKLLVATGVTDSLPPLDGIAALYGRSVFHCPYCDGWEYRDRPLAIYGKGQHGKHLALELTAWSRDLVLCTNGPAELDVRDLSRLGTHSIVLREDRIERLEGGDNGLLQRIVFANGSSIVRSALFFSTGERQASGLPSVLGCTFDEKGELETGNYESTNMPGLYVAGDASRAVQLVVVAAAEGAEAAFAINTALLKEELARAEVRAADPNDLSDARKSSSRDFLLRLSCSLSEV
ncbi:MAG: NAD(P)/FAD-dependent oxidoreductase [Bradyrhizobium sp.]